MQRMKHITEVSKAPAKAKTVIDIQFLIDLLTAWAALKTATSS